MALFDRFRQAPEALDPNVPPGWRTDNAWRQEWEPPANLIREGHYQAAITKLCGPLRPQGYLIPVEVQLVREPGNPHDRNAIACFVDGAHVGYVRADVARGLAPGLDKMRLGEWRVCGVIRGGNLDVATKLGLHVWLGRRLSPGPEVGISGDVEAVAIVWPPRVWEGVEDYESGPKTLQCPVCRKKGRAQVLRGQDGSVRYRCRCDTEWIV